MEMGSGAELTQQVSGLLRAVSVHSSHITLSVCSSGNCGIMERLNLPVNSFRRKITLSFPDHYCKITNLLVTADGGLKARIKPVKETIFSLPLLGGLSVALQITA